MILENNKEYTSAEIAKWMGISIKTFKNYKQKRLEDLAQFCEFEEVKKGHYLIKKVIIPEYDKNLNKTYERVYAALPKYLQSLDTCINVGTKINREVFRKKYSDKYIAALVGQIIKEHSDEFKYTTTVGVKKGGKYDI